MVRTIATSAFAPTSLFCPRHLTLTRRDGTLATQQKRPCTTRRLRVKLSATSTATSGEGGGVEGGGGSALIRFTRPHTMRGTMLGALAGVLRAIFLYGGQADYLRLVPRAILGLIALLCGNAFIVGVNQVYDVSIDRVNKPFLPIASGEMSPRTAWLLVIGCGLLGLAIVKTHFSRLVFGMYAFGMTIGTLYSVPPFRFKRFPILAALTISCVRGFLLNFGVYHATVDALGFPFVWSPPITFLAVFMSVFALVIAIAKDLPDIKGDKEAGVPTFASTRGTKTVVKLVLFALSMNYVGAIMAAFLAPKGAFRVPVMVCGHAILGLWLWRYSRTIRPDEQGSIKRFYAFIWKLFYAEYALFPFI